MFSKDNDFSQKKKKSIIDLLEQTPCYKLYLPGLLFVTSWTGGTEGKQQETSVRCELRTHEQGSSTSLGARITQIPTGSQPAHLPAGK